MYVLYTVGWLIIILANKRICGQPIIREIFKWKEEEEDKTGGREGGERTETHMA